MRGDAGEQLSVFPNTIKYLMCAASGAMLWTGNVLCSQCGVVCQALSNGTMFALEKLR
jgi:hypothetical protein